MNRYTDCRTVGHIFDHMLPNVFWGTKKRLLPQNKDVTFVYWNFLDLLFFYVVHLFYFCALSFYYLQRYCVLDNGAGIEYLRLFMKYVNSYGYNVRMFLKFFQLKFPLIDCI